MLIRNWKVCAGAALIGLWLTASGTGAQGQEVAAHDPSRCATSGIAVGGYDLVSYHAPGGPLKGAGNIVAEHDGLQYLFASTDNRDVFTADPARYLPAYLGWCATALSFGGFVCPDPTNFKIEDGRLFLFETTGFTNGLTVWNSDPMKFRKKADDNYLGLVKPQ